MKNLKKILGLLCVTVLFSSPAMAKYVDPLASTYGSPTTFHNGYGYFRAGLLFVLQEYRIVLPDDRRRLGAHATFGFIKPVSPNWGIGGEFGVGYYGRANDIPNPVNGATIDRTYYGSDGSFVALYHVTENLAVRGRVGLAVIVGAPTGNSSENSRYATTFQYGAGFSYAVSPPLSLTMDYTYICRDENEIRTPRFNVLQIGMEYRYSL